MTWDEQRQSILPRVKAQRISPYCCALFYSADLDQFMCADGPGENSTTTVFEELMKLGIKTFVRLPQSTGLTDYLQVEQNSSVVGEARKNHLGAPLKKVKA